MSKQYWLVKQEPEEYAWSALVEEGGAAWTGVRNFQARNHLRAMRRSDLVFYYHSGKEKRLVGVARVRAEAYSDPTATDGDWSAVDLAPHRSLSKAVTLAQIKADPVLKQMALVRQSRLSVSPVTAAQAQRLMDLAQTKL